ncbi:MAG: lycopene cyclase domain-containing protein [Caldilineaceae bacterium]|nr:lycopene cyclase domain-containing protein [Caldilineaceae bacterium]
MFGTNIYLIWLACFIGIPILALIIWRGQALWQQRRALLWVTAGSLVGGWVWDALAVRFGLWYYDPNHLAGWWWAGLPLEEWLWIVGVTLMFGGLTVALAQPRREEEGS